MANAFRAGDVVEVISSELQEAGERWVVACYEADRDLAWIAGWPCTVVTSASKGLKLHRAATDIEHAAMVRAVLQMRGDHGEGDPRRTSMERVRAAGGTP